MNKENLILTTDPDAPTFTKAENTSDNLTTHQTPSLKTAVLDLIDNGKIRRKESERREETSPVGDRLRRRKWEMQQVPAKLPFEMGLLSCNS